MRTMPPVVENPLFFLDYDGTLAPIVDDPAQAYPHPEAEPVLVELSRRYPLWIVTGRFLKDLPAFFSQPFRAVGLHGMQEGTIGGDTRITIDEDARRHIAHMRATVPDIEGLVIEEKGPTFTVHYRRVADEAAALAQLGAWVAQAPEGLDPIWGKKVVEVRPHGVNKGVAARRIADAHPGHTPVFLGDDVTDEDAFEALGPGAVTIRVGPGETRARYRLADPEAVVAYLKAYVGGEKG